jgi:thiol:disulfide interchange protein DsbD
MKKFLTYLLFVFLIFGGSPESLTSRLLDEKKSAPVAVALSSEKDSFAPKETLWLAIQLQPESGWHLYWKRPGDNGFPLAVEWTLPQNFTAGDIVWPTPERLEFGEQISFGYSGDVTLLVPIAAPKQLKATEPYQFSAKIVGLACSEDTCQPFEEVVEFSLPNKSSLAETNESATLFSSARQKLSSDVPSSVLLGAKHKLGGFVHLELRSGDTLPAIQTAEFFPLESSAIDYHVPAAIYKSEEGWRITLKAEEENLPQVLQGELVLSTADGAQHAWTVDIGHIAAITDEEMVAIAEEIEAFGAVDQPEIAVNQESSAPSLLILIFSAFLGGILLNMMPCVLPVVSLKVLSFVKLAKEKKSLVVLYSAAFSLGVLLSFLALAAVLLLLRQGGEGIGWGFQLQDPFFVACLTLILFMLGLSLLGVVEFGLGLASWAGGASQHSPKQESSRRSELLSSFFSGVLATAVATPCTGPFLGTAMGFAATLPAIESLYIFASVALGMSLPYILLALFPQLLRFLPKPGPWMNYLKQGMGFIMLASVLWLLWVFAAHTGSDGLLMILAALFVASIACWIKGVWDTPMKAKNIRYIAKTCFCVGLAASIYIAHFASSELFAQAESRDIAMVTPDEIATSQWEPFDADRIAALRKQNIPVLVDFTARWCLICQANHIALSDDAVEKYCRENGVVRMKADWTKHNPAITKALSQFGRNSVPLYILYQPGKNEAAILPQVLTPTIVLNYLSDR